VHVKARRVQKLRESCLQVARCTLLLLSSLNILKHRKRFISKYDALICKWICPHTYIITIRDGSLRSRCVFPLRIQKWTEDVALKRARDTRVDCAALHLVQRPYISCVIYRGWFRTNVCLSITVPFERDSIWNCVWETQDLRKLILLAMFHIHIFHIVVNFYDNFIKSLMP